MENLLDIVAIIGLVATWAQVLSARRALLNTTLFFAWIWMLLALLLWSAAWIVTVANPLNQLPSSIDRLWFHTAVLTLCPFIAVLGARRPVSRVWTWFILLPLLVVLEWPVLATLGDEADSIPLTLEGPPIIAYAVVAVMGIGNYVGTRFGIAAILTGIALALLVLPLSTLAPDLLNDRKIVRMLAVTVFSAGACAARYSSKRSSIDATTFDTLWIDFRNWFGIVWASRIQERLNQTAQKEKWPCRVQPIGFVGVDSSEWPQTKPETVNEIEHALRWLLRRFVDESWIDERLHETTKTE